MILLPSEQLQIEKASRSEALIRYHNLKWFSKIYQKEEIQPCDKHKPEPFLLGRIYTFVYNDPKYKDELPFYSAFPISMFIGYRDDSVGNPMMINLHFIPPKIRAVILDKIFKLNINSINDIEKSINRGKISYKELATAYNDLMVSLNKSGFGFAIRSYIVERIKTEPRVIAHRDAWRILTFSNQFLEKKDAMQIYRLYKDKLDYKPFAKEPKLIL